MEMHHQATNSVKLLSAKHGRVTADNNTAVLSTSVNATTVALLCSAELMQLDQWKSFNHNRLSDWTDQF